MGKTLGLPLAVILGAAVGLELLLGNMDGALEGMKDGKMLGL